MFQTGLFDLSDRYAQLSKQGDPLERLNAIMDWNYFRPLLFKALEKDKKNNAGRKAYSPVLMFKILVLQSLYNLSDEQTEFQIRDRLTFMRFLGIKLGGTVPDEKTIWLFRETLVQAGVIEKLFKRFNRLLEKSGFSAKLGMIVDATIIEVPRQRNTREENQEIKEGKVPEEWQGDKDKLRQKDLAARWVQKNGQNYYGYKDHINVDVNYKLIREYEVTSAEVADIKCLEKLLDKNNEQRLWGDTAYRSLATDKMLKERGIENKLQHKIKQGNWLPNYLKRVNQRLSKIRRRVEHIFGFMENSMNGKYIRCVGLTRAKGKIGLMNLAYNMRRYEQLVRLGTC